MPVIPSLAILQADAEENVQTMVLRTSVDANQEDFTKLVDDYCNQFQILAAASLLSDDKPSMFFANLGRAAANWLRLILYCKKQFWTPPPVSYRRYTLGSLVAGIDKINNRLFNECRAIPLAENESPAEYYYTLLLYGLHAQDDDMEQYNKNYYEKMMEQGGPEDIGRADMMQALFEKDNDSFIEAFEQALIAHEQKTEADAMSFTVPVTRFAAHRYLWLEGIVLVKLGQRQGFKLHTAYKYCPESALGKYTESFPDDWAIRVDIDI